MENSLFHITILFLVDFFGQNFNNNNFGRFLIAKKIEKE
jgi:hypothetical protein